MKKEYIKPSCVEQVLSMAAVILTGSLGDFDQTDDPFAAPARRTAPF